MDSGTGASCIYPLLGARMYSWKFLATDIDPESISFANENIKKNNFEDDITTLLVDNNDERKILKDVLPNQKYILPKYIFHVFNFNDI